MPEVLLDLTKTTDALVYKREELIHQAELKRVEEWISEGLKKAGQTNPHVHETITVLGTRGSGKTTFILSLQTEIKKRFQEDVVVLKMIDPTLIEEKGHIFLNVISVIQEKVEEAFEYQEEKGEILATQRNHWDGLLNKLAHGLPSIDGIGGNTFENGWQDAGYIMDKGLQTVSAAHNLRNYFKELVAYALKILGDKKMFLLAFDDIDIDFKKGWRVLEMIRKYFITPQLFTIISGDMELYVLAIRQHYLLNFSYSLRKYRDPRSHQKNRVEQLMTEMESQYLLKVLKPERRVYLTTLLEKMQGQQRHHDQFSANTEDEENRLVIKVQHAAEENAKIELVQFYKELFRKVGIENQYQAEAYYHFLLSLPLRTQVQLLAEYVRNKREVHYANLIDAFLSELLDKNIDVDLLMKQGSLLNAEIVKFLVRDRSLGELYQLQPVAGDSTTNSCVVALTFQFVQRAARNPFLVFDYFIKVGYSRNLVSSLGYAADKGSDSNFISTPSIDGFCKHTGIYQNKVLRDIAGDMVAYLKGAFPSQHVWAGVISLLGLAKIAKQGRQESSNRIDVVFKNEPEEKRILGFLPLSICAFQNKNQTVPCYSVYTLLGAIGEIIRKVQSGDLMRGLKELSQIRIYSVPAFRQNINVMENTYSFDVGVDEIQETGTSTLEHPILQWVRAYPLQQAISPHLLGKISTRLFYALNAIENNEDADNLGDMMHTRIMTLFNAVLVEDARERVSKFRSFNINNTGSSSSIFIQNLRAAKALPLAPLDFSKWMLCCPLLLCYLKPDSDLETALFEFYPVIEKGSLEKQSVYPILRKIAVKANKRIKEETPAESSVKDYGTIATIFRENRVPFHLFAQNADKRERRAYNEEIRSHVSTLLGDVNWSSGQIREFRKYLETNQISW